MRVLTITKARWKARDEDEADDEWCGVDIGVDSSANVDDENDYIQSGGD